MLLRYVIVLFSSDKNIRLPYKMFPWKYEFLKNEYLKNSYLAMTCFSDMVLQYSWKDDFWDKIDYKKGNRLKNANLSNSLIKTE